MNENLGRYKDERGETDTTTVSMGVTTHNTTDADVVVADNKYYKPLDRTLASAGQASTQSITDFFSKPSILQQGVFSTTDSGTTFPGLPLLNSILSKSIYKNKTAGFIGFTATTVLTLQINANPFQQGRYMLCFVPSGGASPTTTANTLWVYGHRFGLEQCSQLPHVELDVNCDTEAQLKIPFVSSESCFSLRNASGTPSVSEIGYFFIRPYVPLVSVAGSTTVSYTLWAHFEDVNLIGPTVPQSNFMPTLSQRTRRKSPPEQEADQNGLGPVSGALTKISKVSNIFLRVPMLSEFASMVGWAADLGSSAAKVFGYSKPLNLAPPHFIQRSVFPNSINVDGSSCAKQLAPTESNQLEMLPDFAGVDRDELSLDYIKSIPSYWTAPSWTTSNVTGDVIGDYVCNPASYYNSYTDNGNPVTSLTPVSFLSQMFGSYRGGVVFRFKIVKTGFHSGRLMAVFIPGDTRFTGAAYSSDLSSYAYRDILDIREANEFTLEVPFISVLNYLPQQNSFGRFVLYVLDPLKAPATVSSSVQIIVEVWGGKDLEFAGPFTCEYTPYAPTVPQSNYDPCNIQSSVIGGAEVKVSDVYARMTRGERILSLRSVLKSSCVLFNKVASPENSVAGFSFNAFVSHVAYSTTSGVVTYPRTQTDFYSMIGSLFTMFRGSIQFHTEMPVDVKTKTVLLRLSPDQLSAADPYNITTTNTNTPLLRGAISFENTDKPGSLSISIPYMANTHSCPLADTYYYGSVISPGDTNNHMPSAIAVTRLLSGSTVDKPNVYRMIGDDFQFGGFISVPPMVLNRYAL